MPNINTAFSLLSAMTAEVALLVYVFIFLSVIKLRYSQSDVARAYKIPGGKIGVWLVASAGLLMCALAFIVGLFPPSQIAITSVSEYEIILLSGVALICVVPFFINRKNRESL